ncbi:MAG: SPOR domain-containing protein [Saprospiraceae bacterium]
MKKLLFALLLIPFGGILIQTNAQVSMQPEADSPDLVKVYLKQDPSTYHKTASKGNDIDFAVQVSASSNPVNESIAKKEWQELGHVYIQKENGLYKTRIGPFTTQVEAKEILLQAKTKGRSDAFIVVLQGTENDKPLYQAGMDNKSTSPSKMDKKVEMKTEPVKNTEVAMDVNVSDYKVQLASYKKPGSFNPNGVEKLGKLESYRKGDMTLMMVGGFKNLPDAKKAREAAKSKGFPEAAIVVDNGGILEMVKE